MKRDITSELDIVAYLHCGKCIEDWKNKVPDSIGESPASFSRLSVGWTPIGLQVWCQRHECNIMHVDFEGNKHPANTKE